MLTIKADHYYFDKERKLIYVHGPAIEMHRNNMPSMFQYWRFTCLSTNTTTEFDLSSLYDILTEEIGQNISPAMRLLYAAIGL